MNADDQSLARLDTFKTRKLANMLVTKAAGYQDTTKLLDLSSTTPAVLLSNYRNKLASFDSAPFDPNGDALRFYDGGYSIWSGYPGTGKSTLLRQLTCHLLHRSKGVFVAHLEEDPQDALIRTANVAFGTALATEQQLQYFVDYYSDRLRMWGVIGLCNHREIFGVIRDLAGQGIKHFIIDSLMCLDVPSDDFELQRKFANSLSALCRITRTHVHLVAHPRKVVSADQEPDVNDVAGSADLGRLADNVLFVRRGQKHQVDNDLTAMQVLIKKQRHEPGDIGGINGWFNRRIRQFKIDQFDQVPTQYLPSSAYSLGGTKGEQPAIISREL